MRAADADGAVDIVFDVGDQHLGPDSGDVLHAPADIGAGGSDAHPGRAFVVMRRVAFGMVLRALPWELHLDAAIRVSEDFFSSRTGDDRSLQGGRDGLRMLRPAVDGDDGNAAPYRVRSPAGDHACGIREVIAFRAVGELMRAMVVRRYQYVATHRHGGRYRFDCRSGS